MKSPTITIVHVASAILTLLLIVGHGYLPPKKQEIIPSDSRHVRLFSDHQVGGSSRHKWLNKEQFHFQCDLRSGRAHRFCGMAITFLKNDLSHASMNSEESNSLDVAHLESLDLSKYSHLEVYLDYEGGASKLRISFRHLNDERDLIDIDKEKSLYTYVFPKELSGPLRLSLRHFTVADWWVQQNFVTRKDFELELNNVVEIAVDLAGDAPLGKHEFRVIKIDAVGKWLSSETLYLLLAFYWLILAAVVVKQRTSDLSTINRNLNNEIIRRELTESKLEKLHASKARFMAETSHDLLQPVSAARLLIATVMSKLKNNDIEGVATDVSRIDSALENSEQLINALRDMSKLNKLNQELKLEHFCVKALMQSLFSEFSSMAEVKGLRLRCVYSTACVYSDMRLLRRILQNLLSNALNYTARGDILFGCRRLRGRLEIQVWDSGPGISQEQQDQVFEEFVRLKSNRSSLGSDNGLGLGLAIVKRSAGLLVDHEIILKSELGRGSMFSVRVPLGDSARVIAAAKPQFETGFPVNKSSFQNIGIVCIDNDVAILDGLESLLLSWGCKVVSATTFAEVHTQVLNSTKAEFAPRVLIVDHQLDDGISGFDELKIARQYWPNIKVLMISADDDENLRTKASNEGCLFLAKPIKPAALRSVITHGLTENCSR